MDFIRLNSGKMLNLNSVTLISIQYNAVVYSLANGSSDREVYEEFDSPEEAISRYEEIAEQICG